MVLVTAGWSASQANAACNASALQGTWEYHALNGAVDDEGETFTYIEDCSFEIDSDATITDSTCSDIGADFSHLYVGATFQVFRHCGIRLVFDGCEYRGQITADKLTASGVGACSQADNLYFDLVKRE
jgi:hypothetical protein